MPNDIKWAVLCHLIDEFSQATAWNSLRTCQMND